jgi:glycerol-3-phosphate O-acyltransferase / dihydroxyacetone phosphate acyltransferase
MVWHLIRILFSIGFDTFYKRVVVKNRHYAMQKGPVIIAMNHPNAFMDPVMFSYAAYPPKCYYLARGDVFKNKFAGKILEDIGIAPIFRIQDGGKEGLKKNEETYQRVYELLKRGEKVMIFAEGLCIMERRLRPVKKGVARMVFNSMEEINDPDLIVVPVGVNYTRPYKFRSHLFFNVGEPIRVADYMEDYKAQPARTLNNFIKVLEPKMKELIVHIDNPQNDRLVERLEEMFTCDLIREQGLDRKNLEHEWMILGQIVQLVNKADKEEKKKIETLNESTWSYFEKLERLKIRDWLIDPSNAYKVNWANFMFRMMLLLVFSPLYILGLAGNYIPYALTPLILKNRIKNIEFWASFNLAIGNLLILIFYLIQFLVVYYLTNKNPGWAGLTVLMSFLTGKFALHYHPFLKKTIGLYRILTQNEKANELKNNREEIVKLFYSINKN